MHRPNREDLIALGEMIEAGTIAPVIDRVYELQETPEALRRIGAGELFGKAVVTV
jgi:NADPH:quinone reductase-like Zn-dependent oxidoreductase